MHSKDEPTVLSPGANVQYYTYDPYDASFNTQIKPKKKKRMKSCTLHPPDPRLPAASLGSWNILEPNPNHPFSEAYPRNTTSGMFPNHERTVYRPVHCALQALVEYSSTLSTPCWSVSWRTVRCGTPYRGLNPTHTHTTRTHPSTHRAQGGRCGQDGFIGCSSRRSQDTSGG